MILEMLYGARFEENAKLVGHSLRESDVFTRKNQLRRVIGDLVNNGFIVASSMDDDYEAALTPEGVLYCEDVLMIR